MTNTRIPRILNGFNTYIHRTMVHLKEGEPQRWTLLGLLTTEMDVLTDIETRWDRKFALYDNKKETRTALVTQEVHSILDEYVIFDQTNHILDRIMASPNANVEDFTIFNIKVRDSKSSCNRGSQIQTMVVPLIESIGGGMVLMKCGNSDDSRYHIIDQATVVQYRYKCCDEEPLSADDPTLKTGVSKKSRFVLTTDVENVRKTIYLYFRWVNLSYPQYAGHGAKCIDVSCSINY